MVKGTIECVFGGVRTDAELKPCGLLFTVGIQETESSHGKVRYRSQCMLLGEGLNPPYVIECLGEAIISMLEEYCEGDAGMKLKYMTEFQKTVGKEINGYLIGHIDEILAGKEKP